MSRIGNRRKAVDLAWKREKELVLEGKGTRNWTKEQQQQIIDEGRATDESGKAYAGHHMKNVAAHPEYQEDPDNIQFLTTTEHKDAHGGNTHIPTNGFYDYKTRETHDFGDNPPVPCEIIGLSEPIYLPEVTKTVEDTKTEVQDDDEKGSDDKVQHTNKPNVEIIQQTKPPVGTKTFFEKAKDVGKVITKAVTNFAVKHPVITAIGIGTATYLVDKAVNGDKSSNSSSGSFSRYGEDSLSDDYGNNYDYEDDDFDDDEDENDVEESIETSSGERATPAENDVSAHRQRYYTKDGVIWKDKDPYHRGGNKEE